MPDLSDTLSAIDAATGCQQCEGPLGSSPSADFCSQWCQDNWFAARSVPLDDYREPIDLPQHVDNLVELGSPETTPSIMAWDSGDLILLITGNAYYRVVNGELEPMGPPDDGRRAGRGYSASWVIHDEIHRLWQDTHDRMTEQMVDAPFVWTLGETSGPAFTIDPIGDLTNWHPIGLINNLRVPTTEPEPAPPVSSLEYDFDFPSNALLAAEAASPPVMTRTTLDIEAIQRVIDGHNGGYLTPERVRRSMRRIDSRGTR